MQSFLLHTIQNLFKNFLLVETTLQFKSTIRFIYLTNFWLNSEQLTKKYSKCIELNFSIRKFVSEKIQFENSLNRST